MPFPYDKYPWLNFHELNLAYFIKHFREIFQQWDSLLNEMHEWKDATDAELAEWKSTVETGISSWETGLRQSMEGWKNETEADISAWEAATLAALDTWKTATTAVFEQIRTEAAASAQAAAGSASAAQTALAGAQAAQATAEAAAAGIQSSLAQIQTNTADIADLKTHLPFEETTSPNLYDNNNPTILNGYLGTASNGVRKYRTGNATKSLLLRLDANTDYTFAYNNTIGGRHVIALFPALPNDMEGGEDVTALGNHVITVGDYSYMHFSTTSNTYLVIYYFNNSDGIEESTIRSGIMVYEGNEIFSYMPYGTVSTLKIKKENINSSGFAGQSLILGANGEEMLWGTPDISDTIHESDIVLNADAQIDNPTSEYYAYRDYDNFPVNKTVRVTRTARIRPQLRITEGAGNGQYEFGPIFIGDQTARENYINTNVNVIYNGNTVQAVVTGMGGWKPVALEHAPHDYTLIGHSTFLNTEGIRENVVSGGTDAVVWTFYSDTGHNYKVQMCATYISADTTDRRPYLSVRTYNGTAWTNWTSLNETGVLHATNTVVDITSYKTITFDDFNNAPANTMYQVDLNCGSAVKHNPAPGRSGVVMTFAWAVSSRHALVQIFYAISNGIIVMYFRYGFQNTSTEFKWTPWERPTTTSIYTAAANVPAVNGNVPGTAIAEPSAGESGTEITLTATAETGYTFDRWEVVSGGVTINNNKFILGSDNAEVNAIFVTN